MVITNFATDFLLNELKAKLRKFHIINLEFINYNFFTEKHDGSAKIKIILNKNQLKNFEKIMVENNLIVKEYSEFIYNGKYNNKEMVIND